MAEGHRSYAAENIVSTEERPSDVDYDAAWSGQWDDMRQYGPMARHSRRLIARMTRDLNPRSILDIGCGEGSLLRSLAASHPGAAMTGAELAATAVELARRNVPAADFAVLDIARGRLPRAFDLIVCSDVVEHIEDDDAALRNMAAMTARGGHVLVATLQGRMRRFEKNVGHVRNYAPGELAQKMTATGLIVDKVIAWGFPFFSPLYRNFLEIIDSKGTTGTFGPARKLVCHGLYALFLLNSENSGDYIFVRARKP